MTQEDVQTPPHRGGCLRDETTNNHLHVNQVCQLFHELGVLKELEVFGNNLLVEL